VKLFAIVDPDVSYFGQKDFQQLRVLQSVARDLRLRTRVVGCPIVREPDGLAMSSRNAYLTADERRDALALSRGLASAGMLWDAGERGPDRLRARVREAASGTNVTLEYVSAADPITLRELDAPAGRAVLSLAARVGKARLIDNALLGMDVSELG
jgi:pantoate--beta-alanine ligase